MSRGREAAGDFPEIPKADRYATLKLLAVRTIFASFVAIPVAAGFLGATLEDSNNESDRSTAQAYERCLDLVKANSDPLSGKATVRLSSLTEAQKEDCGVDSLNDAVDNFGDGGYDILSLDAEVKKVDPLVQLPSIEALEERIPELEASSRDFNDMLIVKGIGLGLLGDAAVFMGAGMTLVYMDQQRERRQRQS